jgi:hypothetical protein
MPTVRQISNPSRSRVCHTGTTRLNVMVEAPFTAATTASKIFFIILSRRPATVPRWKLRISHQAASSVLDTFTCRLVMMAWQLHMTSLRCRLLWIRPYLRPRVLSASRRIRQNAGKPSTTRSIALVRGYTLFRWHRRRGYPCCSSCSSREDFPNVCRAFHFSVQNSLRWPAGLPKPFWTCP